MKGNYNVFFYIGFILTIIQELFNRSTLIIVNDTLDMICTILIILSFATKIILDKHSKKELLIMSIIFLFFIYMWLRIHVTYLLIYYLAFIAAKNIDIRKVIKIDIGFKLVFLFSHSFLYLIDFITGYNNVADTVLETTKGISYTLYFTNPNTVGLLSCFLMIEILYLKKNVKLLDIIICLIFLIGVYFITKSRTSLYSYILFIALYLIKNRNIIDVLYRYSYITFSVISFCMVNFIEMNSSMYYFINDLISNRLGFSILAYKQTSFNILPRVLEDNFYNIYIIDNFYIRCIISYGLITLLLIVLPQLAVKCKNKEKEKSILIVSNIYLFFETATAILGLNPMYIILTDLLFNNENECNSEYKERLNMNENKELN